MNADKLYALLGKLGACEEAVSWAEGKSLEEAWQQCERGDWMLWLCGMMAGKELWPTIQQVVLAACACAEKTLKCVPKGEARHARAIEVASKWAQGKATIQEVQTAATYASSAAAYAASPAAYAAYDASAAAYAAYAASAAAYAAYAASAAAYAASAASAASAAAYTAAAAYAHGSASSKESLKSSSKIVRSMLSIPIEVAK